MTEAHLFVVLEELGAVFKGGKSPIAQVPCIATLPDNLRCMILDNDTASHVDHQDEPLRKRCLHHVKELECFISLVKLLLYAIRALVQLLNDKDMVAFPVS